MRVRVVTLIMLEKGGSISKGVLPTYERNNSSICCPHYRSAAGADLQKTRFAGKSCQNGFEMSREKNQLASQNAYIPLQLPLEF